MGRTLVATYGDGSERPFVDLFDHVIHSHCAEDLTSDCVVVFGGGTDISPAIYGEKRGEWTQHPHVARDTREIAIYNRAVELGCPMIGICRGAQLIAALATKGAPGTLIQHVGGHNTGSHAARVIGSRYPIDITSVHHQMINNHILNAVLGFGTWETLLRSYTNQSEVYFDGNGDLVDVEYELEGFLFHHNHPLAIGIQGHPEYRSPGDPFYEWARNTVMAYTLNR